MPTGLTPTGLTPTGLAQVSGKRDTIDTRPVSFARSTDGPLWTIIIKGIAGAGALAYRLRVVTNGMATRTP